MHQEADHKANQAPPEPLDPQQFSTEQDAAELLSEYWAAEKDPEKLWSTLSDKEQEFFDSYARRGMFNITRLSFSQYFGTTNSTGVVGQWQTQSIAYGGENQENIDFSINEYRSFIDQIVNMACKNRPAFQAQAINTDYESLAQVEASDTLVTYYYEDAYGERREREVVKAECMYGKAYTHLSWDPDGGRIVAYKEQIPSPMGPVTQTKKGRAGELKIDGHFPWEIVCEPYRSELNDHLWRMVIMPKMAKVEAMARWPLYAKQIEQSTLVPSLYEYSVPGSDPMQLEAEGLCAKRIFYHKKTMAMPDGRCVVYINDVQVSDNPLPCDDIPIVPFISCELHGTSFGCSDLWNLIPLEQMQNQVMSDMATNLEAFGRPPLALVEGSDIDIDSLANGQKIVFVPPGKDFQPQPIKFPEFPSFSLKAIDLFRHFKQSLSGLNAIARGDTSTNITSGSHAALYSQIAVEAQSDRQLALDLHREKVGNLIVNLLKNWAKHPQLVAVAGIDERPYMQYFESKDWDGIHRVKIKTVNPMFKTQAGRLQLFDLLKDAPGMPFKDPQRLVEFITSGQFKQMYSPTRSIELRVRAENEKLLEAPPVQQIPGPPDPQTGAPGAPKKTVPAVPVMITDNAQTHIWGHLELLNSPAAQQNPQIMAAILAHIAEHVDMARNGDPYLAQLLGNPPPAQAPGAPVPNMPPAPGAVKGPGIGQGPAQNAVNQTTKVMAPPDQEDDSMSKVPKPAEPPPNSNPAA